MNEIEFHKDPPQKASHAWLTQRVTYRVEGRTYHYEAEGEDIEDLERDWAYKYLELNDK